MVRMITRRLKIAITQRQIDATADCCARDALDTDWSKWLEQYWPFAQFVAVRYVVDWDVDLLILSGGSDVGASPARDAVEQALLDHARLVSQPIIGVCRGMQFLHVADGGKLHRISEHVGCSHAVQSLTQDDVETVNSWHQWGITELTPHWKALACAADGSVEAMQHTALPGLGLMWHPERSGGDLPQMWDWINNNIERRQTRQ